MRTFDEIKADISAAASISDAGSLRELAQEMQALGTQLSTAVSHAAMGMVGHCTGDYSSAMEHYRKALTINEELGDRMGAARDLSNMGLVFEVTGDYPSAMEHYRRALSINEELGDRAGVARTTGNIGIVYSATGDYPSAMEHYRRAWAAYEEIGNRPGMAYVVNSIGVVYQAIGDYPSAMEHFRKALTINEELGNRKGVAGVTANIGIVYFDTGNYRSALEYHFRALAVNNELGDRPGVARDTNNIGGVYRAIGDYQQAIEHYQRALALNEELGNRAGAALVTDNLVATLILNAQSDEAAILLAQEAAMQIDAPQIRAEFFANSATIAEQRGDLECAREHLQKALTICNDAGLRPSSAENHKRLRDLALKRNDLAGYVEHNNEYTRITEEIRGKEATQKLAMMEADRKMEAIEREREKERALLYGALPEAVATRMLRGEDVSGDHFDNASVLFLDIVGFTTISDRIPPGHVVHLLKAIFRVCDDVCTKHGLTKIKTIGDSYLAVAGVPDPHDDHAMRAALAACGMMRGLNTLELTMDPKLGDTSWTKDVGEITVRIGLHCGPLVAGIVGEQRLQYDVWGDTVNVASRMESTGEPGRIHVSEAFKDSLTPCLPDSLTLEERGEVVVKGKGPMTTYWLEGA